MKLLLGRKSTKSCPECGGETVLETGQDFWGHTHHTRRCDNLIELKGHVHLEACLWEEEISRNGKSKQYSGFVPKHKITRLVGCLLLLISLCFQSCTKPDERCLKTADILDIRIDDEGQIHCLLMLQEGGLTKQYHDISSRDYEIYMENDIVVPYAQVPYETSYDIDGNPHIIDFASSDDIGKLIIHLPLKYEIPFFVD